MSHPDLTDWLASPLGTYLLEWEQARYDLMVSDLFGYNALQLGIIEADFLQANRMPLRFRCRSLPPADIIAQEDQLPFDSASLDLVLLPHVLEFSIHPHQVLREVERILVPEGSVIISGFNPFSLWGLRRLMARSTSTAPWDGHYLSLSRIKDWLTLLGLETQSGSFGCYSPPISNPRWLEHLKFMDQAGDRWWPIAGGTYIVQAVKRVQGMRLITPSWRDRRARSKALVPATHGKNTLSLPGEGKRNTLHGRS